MHHIHWRRALLISCLIHLVLLSGLGWLSGRMFTTPEPEDYVEMELISETAALEPIREANPVPAAKSEVVPAAKPLSPHIPDAVAPVAAATTMTTAVAADDVAESVAVAGNAASSSTTSSAPSGGNPSVGTAQARGPRSISPPRILQKTEPRYPEQARQDGVQGTVSVKMEILENGQPGEAWVQRSSGSGVLDETAVQTVQNWRFVPARDQNSGQAIRCYTVLSVVFRLN